MVSIIHLPLCLRFLMSKASVLQYLYSPPECGEYKYCKIPFAMESTFCWGFKWQSSLGLSAVIRKVSVIGNKIPCPFVLTARLKWGFQARCMCQGGGREVLPCEDS